MMPDAAAVRPGEEDAALPASIAERAGCESRAEFWAAVQQSIKQRLGLERFSIWFQQSRLVRMDEGQLVVGVPNVIIQQFLSAQYTQVVEQAVEELVGRAMRVSFEVEPHLFRQMRARQQAEQEEAAREGGVVSLGAAPPRPRVPSGWGFEHLVACASNRLPLAAAREVAGQENPRFRFLYVCGDYGLGKTALLRAMYALAVGTARPWQSVLTSAEDWCNEYYRAIQRKATHVFRSSYRSCGLLLIDDIQFIQGKAGGQQELLHTVKHVLGRGGRVGLAGVCRPEQLNEVEPELVALLRGAFPAVLVRPPLEERIEVARALAVRRGLDAVQEVHRLIARDFGESLAVMDAALCRLALYAGLEGCGKLELAPARDALAVMRPATGQAVTVEAVRDAVVECQPVTREQIAGRSRRRGICRARHVAIYLSRRLTDASLSEIGAAFGGLSHSTVKHAVDKIAEERRTDEALARTLEGIERRLTGPPA